MKKTDNKNLNKKVIALSVSFLLGLSCFSGNVLAAKADKKTAKTEKQAKDANKDANKAAEKLPPQTVYASIVVNTKDAAEEEIHYLTGGYRPFVDWMKEQDITVRLLPVRDNVIYKEDLKDANSSTKIVFCEMERCAGAFAKGFKPFLKRNDNQRMTFLSMSNSKLKKESDMKGSKIAFYGDTVAYFLLEESARKLFPDEYKKNPNLKVTELFNIEDMSHLSKVQLAEYLHDGKCDLLAAPSADMVEITGNHPAAYKKLYVSNPIPSALLVTKDGLDPQMIERLKSSLLKLKTDNNTAKWMGIPLDKGFGGEVFSELMIGESQQVDKLIKVSAEIDNGTYIKKSDKVVGSDADKKPESSETKVNENATMADQLKKGSSACW